MNNIPDDVIALSYKIVGRMEKEYSPAEMVGHAILAERERNRADLAAKDAEIERLRAATGELKQVFYVNMLRYSNLEHAEIKAELDRIFSNAALKGGDA